MSNFKFCKFYGLSAPLAVLLSDEELDSILKTVNSVSGFSLMKNLLLELQYLEKQFTESKIIQKNIDYEKLFNMGYYVVFGSKDLADFRRTYIRTSQHFSKSSEPLTLPNGKVISIQSWEEIKTEFLEVGQQISKQIKLEGSRVLSEETYLALTLIYNRSVEQVTYLGKPMTRISYLQNKIIDVIKDNNIDNLTLYGNKILDLLNCEYLSRLNEVLNSKYYEQFSTLSNSAMSYAANKLSADIERVLASKKTINDTVEELPVSSFADLSKCKTDTDVRLVILAAVQNGTLGMFTNRRVYFDDPELFEFLASSNNYEEILKDFNKYINIEQFLKVVESYDENFFRKVLNLSSASLEELEKVFEDLAEVRVVGLNLHLRDFFLEALRNVNIHSVVVKDVNVESNPVVKENLELLLKDLASKQEFAKAGLVL